MIVKILGTGCPTCKRLEKVARTAIAEMELEEATLIKVTEWDDIMAYDILATPGLVLDEKVVCSGRVPRKAEVISLLASALAEGG